MPKNSKENVYSYNSSGYIYQLLTTCQAYLYLIFRKSILTKFYNWETEVAGGSEQHEHLTACSGTVHALRLWCLGLEAHKVATCPIVLHQVTQKKQLGPF